MSFFRMCTCKVSILIELTNLLDSVCVACCLIHFLAFAKHTHTQNRYEYISQQNMFSCSAHHNCLLAKNVFVSVRMHVIHVRIHFINLLAFNFNSVHGFNYIMHTHTYATQITRLKSECIRRSTKPL